MLYIGVVNNSSYVATVNGESFVREAYSYTGFQRVFKKVGRYLYDDGVNIYHKNWVNHLQEYNDSTFRVYRELLDIDGESYVTHRSVDYPNPQTIEIPATDDNIERVNMLLSKKFSTCSCGYIYSTSVEEHCPSCGITNPIIVSEMDDLTKEPKYGIADWQPEHTLYRNMYDYALIHQDLPVHRCSLTNDAFVYIDVHDPEMREYILYMADVPEGAYETVDMGYVVEVANSMFTHPLVSFNEVYASHSTPSLPICEMCGKETEQDYGRNEHVICYSCKDEYRHTIIMNYSYTPDLVFRSASDESDDISENIYFGIELEVENHSENNSRTSNVANTFGKHMWGILKNFIYMKSDSSIDDGFEIVSHPFTYKWYLENISIFEDLFTTLNSLELRAGNEYGVISCGMHVHVSSGPIPSTTLEKVSAFVYRNKENVLQIADRFNKKTVRRYCYFPSNIDERDFREFGENKRNNSKIEHHAALQFTPQTIEFRIFDGTSTLQRFKKNIEFVKSVLEYSDSCDDMDDISFSNFYDYVNRVSDYSTLVADMDNKKHKFLL